MSLSVPVRERPDVPDVAPEPSEHYSKEGPQPSLGDPRDEAAPADLRRLKAVAKNLPESDPVRRLIEGEPDFLPPSVLAAKADSWVLLLLREG